MEPIKVSGYTVYKSCDSFPFSTEAECLRHEDLLKTYSEYYRTIADGEGRPNHFFYVNSNAEAEECAELLMPKVGYKCSLNPDVDYSHSIIWIPNDDMDGYGPCPTMCTIDDFIASQKDTIDAYVETIDEAEDLKIELTKQSAYPTLTFNISPTASNLAGHSEDVAIEIYRKYGDTSQLLYTAICSDYCKASEVIADYIKTEEYYQEGYNEEYRKND